MKKLTMIADEAQDISITVEGIALAHSTRTKKKNITEMALINVLRMNDGNGDSSYASNSFPQEHAIVKALPFLKQTLKVMANDHEVFFDNCFMIADLGCSSGMNTLSVASNIIDIVHDLCQQNNRKSPQFQVCLNDLFGNDFNSIFKLLPNFYENIKKKGENTSPCYVSAVPGSFHGRLFANNSLHFVHSSYSIQWLSQVPEGLESNKLNIYISKTSPLNTLQAYGKQFHTDFTKFLQLRSEEMVCGGHMFLTLPGRTKVDPASDDDCWSLWDLLAKSLFEMLKEELVCESDINSFNLPCYHPCEDEVRNIIQDEGSFCLDNLTAYEVNWDPYDTNSTNTNGLKEPSENHDATKKYTAKVVRAITEPLLTSHFGESIIDMLFEKYEGHVVEYLANKKATQFTIVISLTKK
ncbi:hypothetical protein SSX86_000872 [Deinandra increscens subsp. villosa]|uniref:Uncharacterized protein n=1 Tax=Deinandra increscens subsp. villosa TaxID=3103831 RepID=A0AAP0DV16_9ASTR